MVLDPSRYNAAYFGDTAESGGLKDVNGYTGGYLQNGQRNRFDSGDEANPYNPEIKAIIDDIESRQTFNNIDVLELGGSVGFYSEYAKALGVRSYDIIDVSNWCFRHKLASVDNFFEADARTALLTRRRNQYNLIFSKQFLECIDDADLPSLITEMNRVALTKQIHIVTETINRDDTRDNYNLKTLAQWATLGFEAGTVLISHNTKQVLVI